MICTEYPGIQKGMRWTICIFTLVLRKKHDIVTRGSRVNNICTTPYIIGGEVKSKEFVVVQAVILKEYKIARTFVNGQGKYRPRPEIGLRCHRAGTRVL
jgi:hypothetical protein